MTAGLLHGGERDMWLCHVNLTGTSITNLISFFFSSLFSFLFSFLSLHIQIERIYFCLHSKLNFFLWILNYNICESYLRVSGFSQMKLLSLFNTLNQRQVLSLSLSLSNMLTCSVSLSYYSSPVLFKWSEWRTHDTRMGEDVEEREHERERENVRMKSVGKVGRS